VREALCALLFVTSFAGAGNTLPSHYPNELKGFRFYAKYLAPLEPGVSDKKAVNRVLGDIAAVQRSGWAARNWTCFQWRRRSTSTWS